MIQTLFTPMVVLLLIIPAFVTASCNIDSAGLKTYSTSDGQVITKVAVVATFRLGCSPDAPEPKIHAETADRQYLAITQSSDRPDFKEASFIEDIDKSKSRWIEINVYDDDTYQKILQARQSGSSESYFKPMKTISVSHYGVYGGPVVKMETVATLALIAGFLVAQSIRNKIAS